MFINMFTNSTHIIWCYFFVNILEQDVRGLGLATLVTFFSNFFYISIYIAFTKDPEIRKTYTGITKESLRGSREYLAIALPSTLLLLLEWSSIEMIMIMAGYIGAVATGACTILVNIFFAFTQLSYGVSQAT